jgi:hypothetical protein
MLHDELGDLERGFCMRGLTPLTRLARNDRMICSEVLADLAQQKASAPVVAGSTVMAPLAAGPRRIRAGPEPATAHGRRQHQAGAGANAARAFHESA